ncbi:MAG: nucleotidyltransferase family protein [Acidimicrobiia bacterium]
MTVAAAVFAAGRGSRLGGDASKPLLEWRGRPLLAWALDAAVGSGLAPVVVTVGYRADEVRAAVPAGVEIVDNPAWEEGIASSLRAVLRALEPRADVTAVVVGLADQPRTGAEAYRRLAAAHEAGAELAVATYEGRRGNPVLLARSLWAQACELTGDAGARQLMGSGAVTVTEVPCDGTGTADDVDTLEDLGRLQEDQ